MNLTIARAAAHRGVKRATIYAAIKAGRLLCTESESGHKMVRAEDLDALVLLVSPADRSKKGVLARAQKAQEE